MQDLLSIDFLLYHITESLRYTYKSKRDEPYRVHPSIITGVPERQGKRLRDKGTGIFERSRLVGGTPVTGVKGRMTTL